MNPSGRFRVIEERQPKVRVISGDGIRWNAALTILVLVSVILCGILLTDLAGMGNSGRMITRLGSRIQAIGDKNEDLKTELEMSTDSATVCTGAVRMDLISSNGAQTIRLTAPQNARFTLTSASAAAENGAKIVYFTTPCVFSRSILTQFLQSEMSLPSGNASLFARSLSYVTGRSAEQAISPKFMTAGALLIPAGAAVRFGILSMAVIPGLILLAGAVIWVRRRRR